MLNISGIKEGVVLDHIQAGKSTGDLPQYLGLGKLDCTVAIIKNARSSKMGRKDIIKIEGLLNSLDLDILGYIDHNITVNIIKDNKIVEKRELKLPKKLVNVIHCKNPRCITSTEQELPGRVLSGRSEKTETYRCLYCDVSSTAKSKHIKILPRLFAPQDGFLWRFSIRYSNRQMDPEQDDKPGYVVGWSSI